MRNMENFETDDFEEYSDLISWKEAREEGIITYGEEKVMGEIVEKYCKKLEKENEELKSIIKEVKEILKDYGTKEDIVDYSNYTITGGMLYKILEILDKDSDKE